MSIEKGVSGDEMVGGARRMFTQTLGVDLSVTRRRTAAVSVEWGDRWAVVGDPVVGVGDGELAGMVAGGEFVGICAPFGWPVGMVSALHAYGMGGNWPEIDKEGFRYRRTDVFVHDWLLEEVGRKVWPLSVSSDGIALRGWRLGRLREEVAERSGVKFDRSGGDGVVEVFPGAALLLWGFERGVYRRSEGGSGEEAVLGAREEFLGSLEAEAPWLRWSGDSREVCVANEDAIDGLICALVARAAGLGLTQRAVDEFADDGRREGWVHLPEKGGLSRLVGGEVGMASGV